MSSPLIPFARNSWEYRRRFLRDLIDLERLHMAFDTYVVNGVERISVPSDISSSIRHRMLDLYRPIRWYAKVAWKLEQKLTLVGLSKFCSTRMMDPSSRLDNFDWRSWLAELAVVLKAQQLLPAFYFPPQVERKKCSVLLFDTDGCPVAYGKLAWGNLEKVKLSHEISAMILCSQLAPQTFRIPALLHSGTYDARPYCLFEPLPKDSKAISRGCGEFHLAAWSELSSATQHNLHTIDIPWWGKTTLLPASWSDLLEKLASVPANELPLSWAHGDFAVWNTCIDSTNLYIFDWEDFEPHAPLWLDLVYCVLSYELLVRRNRNRADIIAKICDMMKRSSIPWNKYDLALALVYLRIQSDHSGLSSFFDELPTIIVR